MDFDDVKPQTNATTLVLRFAPKSSKLKPKAKPQPPSFLSAKSNEETQSQLARSFITLPNPVIITPTTKKVKLSEIETKDRLSNLSDCLILHIISSLNARQAVQTCVLSSRWKNLWKRIHALTLHSIDFRTYRIFTKFMSKVLSLRDSSISLQALDLRRDNVLLGPHILKKIVNYAISHNVEQLGLCVIGEITRILPTMFSCHTLTHLKLCFFPNGGHKTLFPNSLNLPALSSLQLGSFKFCVGDDDRAEPFSGFNRLNSLLISNCTVGSGKTLCISSATLVNLTVYNKFLNFYTIELCTPILSTFAFTGTPYQKLDVSDALSLKHVDIFAEVIPYEKEPPLFLLIWLRKFLDIKSLTVSATTLQVLHFIPNLLRKNLRSLSNLKSLKVKMERISYEFRQVMLQKVKSDKEAAQLQRAFKGLEPFSLIPDGIVDFLLQNSPLAKVDYIDCSRQPLRETHL